MIMVEIQRKGVATWVFCRLGRGFGAGGYGKGHFFWRGGHCLSKFSQRMQAFGDKWQNRGAIMRFFLFSGHQVTRGQS